MTQSISAARVLFSSFTLDIKTDAVPTHCCLLLMKSVRLCLYLTQKRKWISQQILTNDILSLIFSFHYLYLSPQKRMWGLIPWIPCTGSHFFFNCISCVTHAHNIFLFFLYSGQFLEELHCGYKQKCTFKGGNAHGYLKAKMCSAWGDSYYRTFDGRDFTLQGNCNYTLVQTTRAGLTLLFDCRLI